MLVLHFLDGRRSQRFKVTRKLRGLATSPTEKQRPQPEPSKPPPCGKESGRAAKRRQKKARQRNVQVRHSRFPWVTEHLANVLWAGRIEVLINTIITYCSAQ